MAKNNSTHFRHIHFQKAIQAYCLFKGNGKNRYYGCYLTLEDAIYDRNIFVMCEWDWELFLNYTPDYSKNPIDIPHFPEWSELYLFPIKNITYFDTGPYGAVYYVLAFVCYDNDYMNSLNMGRFIYLENAMKYRDVCVEYSFDSHLVLDNCMVSTYLF